MNNKIVITDANKSDYEIIFEFNHKLTNKSYMFYKKDNAPGIYASYCRKENDNYILEPIKDEEDKKLCKDIIKYLVDNYKY